MVLSKVEEAKFRKPVVPGDQLKLAVKMLRQKAGFYYFSAQATVEGEIVAEGRLTGGLMKKSNRMGRDNPHPFHLYSSRSSS